MRRKYSVERTVEAVLEVHEAARNVCPDATATIPPDASVRPDAAEASRNDQKKHDTIEERKRGGGKRSRWVPAEHAVACVKVASLIVYRMLSHPLHVMVMSRGNVVK